MLSELLPKHMHKCVQLASYSTWDLLTPSAFVSGYRTMAGVGRLVYEAMHIITVHTIINIICRRHCCGIQCTKE